MLTAGVQPPQDPGESKGETVLAKRFRERGGKNVADKKTEERKKERKKRKKNTGRPSFFGEQGP